MTSLSPDVASAFSLIRQGLGAVRRVPPLGAMPAYEEICTTIQYVSGTRVAVWTRVPDGMTPEDLGRRFLAARVDVRR